MSSQEGPPTVTEAALAEYEKTGGVKAYDSASGRWKYFSNEAMGLLLKSRESPYEDEEEWQKLEVGDLSEGNNQEGLWQKKRFIFGRENGTQQIEERVTAKSTDHEYFDSQDRDLQGKVKKESELILILEDGQRIKLNDLLPPGISFRPHLNEEASRANRKYLDRDGKLPIPLAEYKGNNEQYHERGGKLLANGEEIVYGNLGQKGGLMWLFHEIGHAWDRYHNPHIEKGINRNLFQLIKVYSEQQPEDQESLPVDDSKVKIIRDLLDDKAKPLVVEKEVLARIVQEGVDSERGPSAFALNLCRGLKKEGVDVEPGTKVKELDESIKQALVGYQTGELDTFYYSEEDREKMKDYSYV